MCYRAEHRQLPFCSWLKYINVDSYFISAGAFLIPYFTNLVFTGLPLFFFELSLGQYARSSPIALWSVIPLFQGKSKASSDFPMNNESYISRNRVFYAPDRYWHRPVLQCHHRLDHLLPHRSLHQPAQWKATMDHMRKQVRKKGNCG